MTNSLVEHKEELKQTIQRLEEKILEWALEKGRQVLKAALEELDNLLILEHGGNLYSEHIRAVTYTTILGDIRVSRRQYLDKTTGEYRYLLDELLGMQKNDHTTINVKSHALKLAVQTTFRKSAEILEELSPTHLSHQSIWKLVGKTADPHLEKRDREIEQFAQTGELPASEGRKVPHLMVEGDGVMVPLQREKARKAEIKVGIAYEGWEQVGRNRYKTVNKSIYADVNRSDAYWAGVTLDLYGRYDMSETQKVILGGDGAEWVKEGINYVGGVFQLDRYHLNRELRTALGTDHETVRLVSQACQAGDANTACQLLLQAEKRAKGEQARKISQARHYLRKNESGLRDYRLDLGEEGKALRRTGAMEGNVDKLVVRRMKGQGMSWTIKGCRRMLWARFQYLRGTIKETLYHPPIQSGGDITSPVAGKVERVIERLSMQTSGDWLNVTLPALSGPHCGRPWALALKSLTQGAI